MGITTTAALVVTTVLAKLLGDEAKAWLPKIVERLVRRAVRKLPDAEKERFDEEWRADLDETPGDLGKLLAALGFQFAALGMCAKEHSPVERLRHIALKVKHKLSQAVLSATFKALGLFALLVAAPFLLERLLGHNPQMAGGGITVRDSFWQNLLSHSGFGIVVLLLVGFLTALAIFLPQTYQISEYLSLAEREMNRLLRGGNDAEARTTAFLLHKLYEGNVANAQLIIRNEIENGGKPFIAPGVRQIVGYDRFNERDVKNNGFPPGAGVGWFPLWLAVKLNRFPRNIVMVRSDKTVAANREVIDELNREGD